MTLRWLLKLSCECGCVGNDLGSENHRLHPAGLESQLCLCEYRQVDLALTWFDIDRHGGLLNNGSDPRKGSEAAVVPPAVFLHRVREVQVSVQACGHPLILFDVPQI